MSDEKLEKKVRDALKKEASKVHPKGTLADIRKKIERKKDGQGKGSGN